MTCAELDDRAIDYLYGELGDAARAEVEAHVAGCDACRQELAGLGRTLGVTREALRGPLNQEPPPRVRALVQAEAVRAAAQMARARIGDSRSGWAALSDWLKRPWFIPAVASVSAIALFFIGKQAIYDAPKRVLESVQPASELELPAPPPPPVPVQPAYEPPPQAAAPPATQSGASVGAPMPEEASARGPASPRPAAAKAEAKRDSALRRRAAPRPAAGGAVGGFGAESSRWATPPPAAPAPSPGKAPAGPAAASPPAAAAAKPRALPKDDIESVIDRAERQETVKKSKAADTTANRERAEVAAAPAAVSAPARPMPVRERAGAPAPSAAPAAPSPQASLAAAAEAEDEGGIDSGFADAPAANLSLEDLQRRAAVAFQQARWDRAARDYRELLRRFPNHREVPFWRRRLELSTQNR